METKDQSTAVNQNTDLQDSTTAENAITPESTTTSEKLDTTVEENELPQPELIEVIKKDDVKEEVEKNEEDVLLEEPISKEAMATIEEVVEPVQKEQIIEEPQPITDSKTENSEEEKVATQVEETSDEKVQPVIESKTDNSEEEKVGTQIEEASDKGESIEDFSNFELEDLVKRLIELVNEAENILSIKDKVASIKGNYIVKIKDHKQSVYDQFIKDGGVEEDYKSIELPFENNYKEAFATYKNKRTSYLKELEKVKEANLIKKEELLANLREMIKSDEPLKKTYDEFKNLQENWRQIGMIPQGKVKDLWENYHFLVDQFFDKVQISRELRDLDLRKNLEEKTKIAEKVEALLLEKSINKSFKLLQEYHDKWREIGSVPSDKNDEIWDRFKAATDKINKRRHEYYEKLQEDQKNNLMLKAAICEKIEELVEIELNGVKEWNTTADKVNALFDEWKTLGPAPKKQNDEIWNRFKSSMNQFFDQRKKYFNRISEEQMYNYNLKLDICKQAEAAKDSTEWKDTSNELIKLQKQWKELGSVPRKYSDKIWKRFRAACDHFFNAKSEYFKNIGSIEENNLDLKKELIEKLKVHKFSDKKEDNLKTINEFQKEWSDIGRVPFKELNRIQKEFRKHIDKCLDNLNIDTFEFQNMNLKAKIDGMKNKGDAKNTIIKEIGFLRTKIDKIKADVILWETNMGFFANSKNADLLKQEFEKKIDKAKSEMDTFKAKIRQLDKMKRGLEQPKEEKPEA